MRIPKKCVRAMFLASATVLLAIVPALHADDAAFGKKAVFFSQGQAVDIPQDRAKSKHEAIQDFLTLAVTQALGRFLSPSEMASRMPTLRESMLKQPERYVETYQVFSEGSMNGLYRVTGQVTVAIEPLQRDLQESGLPVSADGRAEQSAVQEETVRDTQPNDDAEAAGSATAAVAAASTEVAASAREPIRESREILWAVTEKWDQEWSLPADIASPQSPFAAGAAQELEDFGWSLRLPEKKSLAVDHTGNISTEQVLSQAKEMGIQRVVIGAVALRQRQGEGTRLITVLRVLNVSTQRSVGEIRKEMTPEEGSNQESALALASAVAPQLDRLLDGSPRAGSSARDPVPDASPGTESPPSNPPAASPPPESPAREGGGWLVRIRARQQFPVWQEMEKMLREHFKSMQVKSLQFGAGEIVADLEGVDGQYLSSLNGTPLPGGDVVQVDACSPQERSITITVSRGEKPEAGPKQ